MVIAVPAAAALALSACHSGGGKTTPPGPTPSACATSGVAGTNPLTVTNLNDSGSGSLRAVVAAAGNNSTIGFAPGLCGTIALVLPIDLTQSSLTIQGNGTATGGQVTILGSIGVADTASVTLSNLTVTGNGATALTVGSTGTLELVNAAVSNSRAAPCSALIAGAAGSRAAGIVTLKDSVVSNNQSATPDAPVCVNNYLIVDHTTVEGNSSAGAGAIVVLNNGVLDVEASTFSQNTSGSNGGAVAVLSGTAAIENSTLFGNTASSASSLGSAAYVGAGAALAFNESTVDGNISKNAGNTAQVVAALGGTLGLHDTIIANANGNASPDISGVLAGLPPGRPNLPGQSSELPVGYNLIENATGASGFASTDILNKGPGLSNTLANNGGLTQTLVPNAGAPVIDAGDPASGNCLLTDQRDVTRPQNGRCDIGAVEYRFPPSPP